MTGRPHPLAVRTRGVLEVFLVATRLGLTSFGGPVAHIAYFRAEYVERRRWLGDQEFADLTGLCQLLPGPASSQLGFAVGLARARLPGGIAAWLGFTLPSAVALVALALLGGGDLGTQGWVAGLKVVAVAVVAQAVWAMARTSVVDWRRAALAIGAAATLLLWESTLAQLVVIAAAGGLGALVVDPRRLAAPAQRDLGVSRRLGAVSLCLFLALLVGLPVARQVSESQTVAMTDSYYRSGALVFGGGHVVLPLLEREVVPTGWVDEEDFVAGYGAAQAVPGPLFTFAAYLGAAQTRNPDGVVGAATALGAVFLPGLLLVVGVMPFWHRLRLRPRVLPALAGVNAAVVGVLAAALYDPVLTSAIGGARHLAIALLALAALAVWRAPPWAVVVACAAIGWLVL